MGQSFSYLLLYYSFSKETLYLFIDSFYVILMNNIIKAISALVIIALITLIVLTVPGILYGGTTPLGGCSGAPSVVLSEFKEENNSGIYTTEILEYEKTDCSNAWKNMYIYLLDAEGVVHGDEDPDDFRDEGWFDGGKFIANYEGENPNNINMTSNIANDTNGTKYPLRIINNMSGEPYESYIVASEWREGSYDYGLKLSVGDKIIVYGSGSEADGIAREGWSLRIKYEITGETLSEIKIA